MNEGSQNKRKGWRFLLLTLGCRINEGSQNKQKGWRSLLNLINGGRGFDILKYSLTLVMNEKRDINI